MKILVTGGAGYIGSVLTPLLLNAGHEVTVVDNFLYRQPSLAAVCINPKMHLVRGDVRHIDLIKPLAQSADLIIPLAALVGAPICAQDPVGATSINKTAVLNLFEKLSSSQAIIMPTTNSAYGSGKEGTVFTEDAPLNPISQYAIEKVQIENELMARENSISLRLATVFGMSPRMRTDLLVNDFVYRAVTDKSIVLFEKHFKRNYIHVRDVARGFLHCMAKFDTLKGEVFNLGLSDANLSKQELCVEIQKEIPSLQIMEAEFAKDPDQRNYVVSNDKIERTGFAPKHSLQEGIAELIKGYQMIRNSEYSNV